MSRSLTIIGLVLLLAACSSAAQHPSYYNASTPSPHYGTTAPCPSSATSIEGGNPSALDCVPGGTE